MGGGEENASSSNASNCFADTTVSLFGDASVASSSRVGGSRRDGRAIIDDSDSGAGEGEDDDNTVETGLLLAVVERGPELSQVVDTDSVPSDARRKAGVSVLVTYMYYGLVSDGQISAERTRRFALQTNFRRRELNLPHGSLVSGLGSWGGPENAPIKLFGFRLTDSPGDRRRVLQVIEGVSKVAMPGSLREACQQLAHVVPGIDGAAKHAERASEALTAGRKNCPASQEQIAAFYLYTMETQFYRRLNASMRDEDRSLATPFFGYLRLLFSGLETMAKTAISNQKAGQLFRGVHLDLSVDHEIGDEVVWWGASSCTPKMSVAKGFLGSSGNRTLFTVNHMSAVPIKEFSAFRGEEEWLLAPGTKLRVDKVEKKNGGLFEITLQETPPPRAIH